MVYINMIAQGVPMRYKNALMQIQSDSTEQFDVANEHLVTLNVKHPSVMHYEHA